MVRANHTMLLEDNSLQSNTKPAKPRFNQLWKRYQNRTYGAYQVYRDGQPIADLSGNVCECTGPGENSVGQTSKRIEEGRYPLWTQFGIRYHTVGYSTNMDVPA